MTGGRDHGGDLGRAIDQFGGDETSWIDLSTGINRVPYPIDGIDQSSWSTLPRSAPRAALITAAQTAYQTTWPLLPVAGAQAAIQLLPHLLHPGLARILAPTYNEFEGALLTFGWQVENVAAPADLRGADMAIVVNPNNPTGRCLTPMDLDTIAAQVGILIVDESFADATPDTSLLRRTSPENVLVLRSFGKFFGLAGLRLGFVAGAMSRLDSLAERAGPWAVSGPALDIGARALCDLDWQAQTRLRLAEDARRMDALIRAAGWTPAGGTHLFALAETPDAEEAQTRLAKARIWSRVFPYSKTWLRLGFPGSPAEWERLSAALT